MIRRWSVTAALTLCFVGALGASAAAQPRDEPDDARRLVGVLEVRVDGVPDEVKESFQRGLEAKFDAKHYRLASRARLKQLMASSTKWTEGCLVGQCLAELRAQTGADLVLLAALTGAGTSFGYVVTLVRTDTGRVLRQDAQRCDVCTVNEAMDKAMRATTDLLDQVPAALPDEAAEHTALNLAVGKARDTVADRERRRRRIGLSLAIVGVAALVTGATMLGMSDDSMPGAALVGGGAGVAASGVVVLTF